MAESVFSGTVWGSTVPTCSGGALRQVLEAASAMPRPLGDSARIPDTTIFRLADVPTVTMLKHFNVIYMMRRPMCRVWGWHGMSERGDSTCLTFC